MSFLLPFQSPYDFLHPIDAIENTYNSIFHPIKHIEKITSGIKNTVTHPDSIVKNITGDYNLIVDDMHMIGNFFQNAERFSINLWKNDIVPFSRALYKIVVATFYGLEWLIDHYQIVLFGVLSYGGLKYLNALRKIL
jgi:hypothetical protein